MIKLTTLLREIGAKLGGEGSVKPFDSTRMSKGEEENPVKYKFKTDSGTVYRVYIHKHPYRGTVDYEVAFGALTDSEYPDYSYEVNDMKSLFRVMATVIEVVKKEMEEDTKEERDERGELVKAGREVKSIQMEPSKRLIRVPGDSGAHKFDKSDMRRYNLYMAYIEKNMPPGSKVNSTEDGSVIRVDLPTEG